MKKLAPLSIVSFIALAAPALYYSGPSLAHKSEAMHPLGALPPAASSVAPSLSPPANAQAPVSAATGALTPLETLARRSHTEAKHKKPLKVRASLRGQQPEPRAAIAPAAKVQSPAPTAAPRALHQGNSSADATPRASAENVAVNHWIGELSGAHAGFALAKRFRDETSCAIKTPECEQAKHLKPSLVGVVVETAGVGPAQPDIFSGEVVANDSPALLRPALYLK